MRLPHRLGDRPARFPRSRRRASPARCAIRSFDRSSALGLGEPAPGEGGRRSRGYGNNYDAERTPPTMTQAVTGAKLSLLVRVIAIASGRARVLALWSPSVRMEAEPRGRSDQAMTASTVAPCGSDPAGDRAGRSSPPGRGTQSFCRPLRAAFRCSGSMGPQSTHGVSPGTPVAARAPFAAAQDPSPASSDRQPARVDAPGPRPNPRAHAPTRVPVRRQPRRRLCHLGACAASTLERGSTRAARGADPPGGLRRRSTCAA